MTVVALFYSNMLDLGLPIRRLSEGLSWRESYPREKNGLSTKYFWPMVVHPGRGLILLIG
jgi:hypothetical protein